jgi:hypothetical protein
MAKLNTHLPDRLPSEEEGGLLSNGGPEAVPGSAWGTHEPILADLEIYLDGVEYPVAKQGLVRQVKRNGGPTNLVATLDQLPDQRFDSAADIMQAVSEIG